MRVVPDGHTVWFAWHCRWMRNIASECDLVDDEENIYRLFCTANGTPIHQIKKAERIIIDPVRLVILIDPIADNETETALITAYLKH